MDQPPPVFLSLHGVAQVQRAGMLARPLERKQAALLAWLALEGPTPRARIATLLWPDANEERARANLRQRLAKLRALDAGLLQDDGSVLALAAGVAVAPANGRLLAAFDYADCDAFASWLEGQRDSAQNARRDALKQQARTAIECADLGAAQHHAEALLALDRESEDAHRLLMEVLYLRGDYAQAITLWDRCREVLRMLYGVPPSSATQALGELVLQAARAGRAAPVQERGAMPLSLLRPPQLIGRSRALDALLAGWYAGQVLCVSGAAGLGKSRLLGELVAAVGGGASVAARPGDEVQPYAALGRLLLAAIDRSPNAPHTALLQQAARIVPALRAVLLRVSGGHSDPEALRTAHQRTLALQAAAQLLQACASEGCDVFVFDDLQFADAASVEALPLLLEATSPALRLALGSRAGEETPAGQALLDLLARQARLLRVDLEPLAEPEVTRLLASLALPGLDAAALAPVLRQRVGGNPAFLLESLKLLLSLPSGAVAPDPGLLPLSVQVAPGINAVVARRIELLSPAARQVAQLAGVAGADFSPALAGAALALAPPELAAAMRELEQRQVLYGRRFVHDLVAAAVRQTTRPEDAEQAHRRVAEALQAQGAEPARVAGHWRECGQWLPAGQGYRTAALAAQRALRPAERSQLLDAAIDCFERAGADAQAELFDAVEERLTVSDAPDRMQRRVPLMDRLDALARTPQQELRALIQRVGWHADHHRDDGVELGRQGMARAFVLGLPALAFGFVNGVAWPLALAGKAQQAVDSIERHRAWAQIQPAATQAEFHSILSGVQGFNDHLLPAIASAEDAVAQLRNAGRPERTLPMLSNIGVFRWWRGELDAAKATLLQAQVLRDRMLGGGAGMTIDLLLGAVLRDRGEYAAAGEMLAVVLASFQAAASAAGPGADATDMWLAQNHLAELCLRTGRAREALAWMQHDGADPAIDVRFRARRAVLQLRAARMLGQVPDQPLLDATRAMAGAIGSPYYRAGVELELARALAPAAAAQEFARLFDTEPLRQRPGLQLHAALRAAQAALACEDHAAVQLWLRRIDELADRCVAMDIDRAELWLTRGHCLAAGSDDEAARSQWQQGVAWVERTAAHHVLPAWRDAFTQSHPVHQALLRLG